MKYIIQHNLEIKEGIYVLLKQKKSNMTKHCLENGYQVTDTQRRLMRKEINKVWLDGFVKTIDARVRVKQHVEVAYFYVEE